MFSFNATKMEKKSKSKASYRKYKASPLNLARFQNGKTQTSIRYRIKRHG